MKILKVLKKIGTSILLGVVDSVPILPNIKNNYISDNGFTKNGSLDIIRITTSLISVILIVGFLIGKIDIDQLVKLLDYFK